MKNIKIIFILILFIILVNGCKKNDEQTTKTNTSVNQLSDEELFKKYGSKTLTKEQIDKLISSIKWTTNNKTESLGSKDAKKGGIYVEGSSGYPPTLRTIGENTANTFNSDCDKLVYERLLGLHPITLEYVPGLADKWSIADDKLTFYFHIDSRAKWQDGIQVTSFDVVSTWDLNISDGIKDPFNQEFWNNYERPIALSKDIIMVKAKVVEWNKFLYFAQSFSIFPEHIIGKITPEQFMTEYQNKMLVGSGPYMLENSKTNDFITLKRVQNWWGYQIKSNENTFNFDKVKFIFYPDENIIEEKFKKGEIDIQYVAIYKWINIYNSEKMEQIKNNKIIKQRIYNNSPTGINGYDFNMREEPFNDIKVRKAFFMLLNRELMMTKLFYNEYKFMNSYFANSPYENPDNPKTIYSPDKAIELLEQAGYSQKNINKDGYIVKNGNVFELNLDVYFDDTRVETIYQEDLKKVGIKLNINKVTWAKHIKDAYERNFKISPASYAVTIFPYPKSEYYSTFADKKNTNNFWGLKNKRVDEICDLYNQEFDLKKRIKLIQELDRILANEYIMVLKWYNTNLRLLYWNKFGMPDFVLDRYARDYTLPVIQYWWFDEKANDELKKAKGKNIMLLSKPAEVKYWDKYK